MTEIHPSAIIHPSASLAPGCQVGPYCLIGTGVILGEECKLHGHVVIEGPCTIGPSNTFFPFTSIGQTTQDLKYLGEPTFLEIGGGNTFREFTTVHRSTASESKTVIGNQSHFLAYSHIAHDCVVGNHVIFSNNGTLAGHVVVEDHAIIGGLTAVHQFCRIGRHAITGGCSKIVQDVPPFMIADGNPAEVRGVNAVGLKRHGFKEEEIVLLKEAYRILYRSALNVRQAVEKICKELSPNPHIEALVRFVETSTRGIVR